jgi:CobQ-like glutamine amidotransferase family enzyme
VRALHILQLYIDEMNTYGDRGNLLALAARVRRHGLDPVIHYHHVHGEVPETVDLVLGGGGQDAAQRDVQEDVQRIGDRLHELAGQGVPMLAVCGTYQLFAHRFVTVAGQEIPGIGIFDAETLGGTRRLIGNVAVQTGFAGTMYGFENHSGRTYLKPGQAALGTVTRGSGNNGEDRQEGARTGNVFGTYLHGPVLPTNPAFADCLIRLAVERTGEEFVGGEIDDSLADQVRRAAVGRRY